MADTPPASRGAGVTPNDIHWHMVKFYTQIDFRRVQECTNRSSDDKVMVV